MSKPNKTLYKTQDGTAYLVGDARELVTIMRRKADFDHSATNKQHMLKVAKRVFDEFGLTLSTESPEAFVASMIATRLLTIAN